MIGSYPLHLGEHIKGFLQLLLSRSCRFSSSLSRYSAGPCRCGPSPNCNRVIGRRTPSWKWEILLSTSHHLHMFLIWFSLRTPSDVDPDTTWPPDGVSALQDDPSEQREVEGIHLQPLVRVLVLGTPGAIIQVAVFDAWLKTCVTQRGFQLRGHH